MASLKKVFLNTNPTKDEIKNINIGDIVYLNGSIYTAREGIYKKVLEEHADLPLELPKESATNFHCSPAAVQNENGDFNLGAVTATASFRFSRWIGDWLKISGAKLIIGKDKKFYHGEYLFTLDWAHPETNILNTEHSEIPQEHKCAHIIALKNGNYAAQPNNRIIWSIPSFTVKDEVPYDWKVQTSEWNVEDTGQWKTEDTDKFFYEIEEKKHD